MKLLDLAVRLAMATGLGASSISSTAQACGGQPTGVPWPAGAWPTGALDESVDQRLVSDGLQATFAAPGAHVRALLVVQNGRIVVERYGEGAGPNSRFLSHSIAKFVLGTLVGMLVEQGRLVLDAPVWQRVRQHPELTIRQLMMMRSGLAWNETYTNLASNLPEAMLGQGRLDQARYVASLPASAAAGTRFSYSSGDANLLSGVVRDQLGGGRNYRQFIDRNLFGPLGLTSAEAGFDSSGTYIASSWFWATARDFARIGYLHLRDGEWAGNRLLPADWRSVIRNPSNPWTAEHDGYGALTALFSDGAFGHTGFRGQLLLIDDARDLVIVRLADTGGNAAADAALRASLATIRTAFPVRNVC